LLSLPPLSEPADSSSAGSILCCGPAAEPCPAEPAHHTFAAVYFARTARIPGRYGQALTNPLTFTTLIRVSQFNIFGPGGILNRPDHWGVLHTKANLWRVLKVASVAERVIEIVAEQLGQEKDKIKPETSFVNDLGADSLDTVELVMELEEEFDINIPDDAAEKIQTVGQAIEYIEKTQS
jgi:acyl carrier protein